MDLQTSFDVLSRIVEQYESNGRSVRHVEATASEEDEGTLHVTMDVPVSLCSASDGGLHSEFTPEAATLTGDGGLQVEFSTPILATLPSTTAATISASNQAVRVADDAILLTVELIIDPIIDSIDSETQHTAAGIELSGTLAAEENESSSDTDQSTTESRHGEEPTDEPAAVRDESVPPYEDTEYLQRLYDSCETFAEMSRKIEMEVTSETVRRYMIETDIHTPNSHNTVIKGQADHPSETAEAPETEMDMDMDTDINTDMHTEMETPRPTPSESMETTPSEQLVTDGIGLPEDLRIEDIMDAVVDSVTVYEVQRHLGLERRRTQELLEQLNLLDLVVHRIADNPDREVSVEEVATRIRQCASSGS
jgi:hypothetical protein